MYPSALPCPYFRRDIIVDLGVGQMTFAERSYMQVERGVIDEDEGIGALVQQSLTRDTEVISYVSPMAYDGYKTHEGHMPYMPV